MLVLKAAMGFRLALHCWGGNLLAEIISSNPNVGNCIKISRYRVNVPTYCIRSHFMNVQKTNLRQFSQSSSSSFIICCEN